jgi:hypothetical protein
MHQWVQHSKRPLLKYVYLIVIIDCFYFQVEYRPLSIASQCQLLMIEFIRTMFPACATEIPIHITRMNPNEQYYPIDTVQQYLDLFLDLRRRSTGGAHLLS